MHYNIIYTYYIYIYIKIILLFRSYFIVLFNFIFNLILFYVQFKNIEDEIIVLREENSKHLKELQNLEKFKVEAKNSKNLSETLKKEIDEFKLKYDKAQTESTSKIS